MTRPCPPGCGPAASYRLGADALRRGRWTEAEKRLTAPELSEAQLTADALHLLGKSLPGSRRKDAIATLRRVLERVSGVFTQARGAPRARTRPRPYQRSRRSPHPPGGGNRRSSLQAPGRSAGRFGGGLGAARPPGGSRPAAGDPLLRHGDPRGVAPGRPATIQAVQTPGRQDAFGWREVSEGHAPGRGFRPGGEPPEGPRKLPGGRPALRQGGRSKNWFSSGSGSRSFHRGRLSASLRTLARIKREDLRPAALYYRGESLRRLERRTTQKRVLEELLALEQDHEFGERALYSLARSQLARNDRGSRSAIPRPARGGLSERPARTLRPLARPLGPVSQ